MTLIIFYRIFFKKSTILYKSFLILSRIFGFIPEKRTKSSSFLERYAFRLPFLEMAWPSDTALGKNGRQPKGQTKGDGMILSPVPAKIVDNPSAVSAPQPCNSKALCAVFHPKARKSESRQQESFRERMAKADVFDIQSRTWG